MTSRSLGLDYNDDEVLLDDLSVELNTKDEIQVYGYEDATATEPNDTSLFPYRPDPGEGYLSNMLWSSAYSIVDVGLIHFGNEGGGGWGEGWPDPPAQAHSALSDIAAATAGDDHNGTLTTGNYPYIGSRGDYDRNKMTNGLGDADGVGSVNVSGRELLNGSAASQLDWANRDLEGGAWKVTNTTDITPGTAASGSFQVAGGLSVADRAQVLDATEADGDKAGALSVAGGVDVKKLVCAQGGLYVGTVPSIASDLLHVNVTDISLIWSSPTGITITGATGGGGGFDIMQIQVPDGSGGTKTIEVLARAI